MRSPSRDASAQLAASAYTSAAPVTHVAARARSPAALPRARSQASARADATAIGSPNSTAERDLTPHVAARFYEDDAARAEFLAGHAALREALARAARPGVIAVAGFEYTDHYFGHVGAAFADPARVLADVPSAAARARPARFFEAWVAAGGTLVVNHPLATPLASSVPIARADLSWRPWTRPGEDPAPEIAAADALAHGFEAYNLTAAHRAEPGHRGDAPETIGSMKRLAAVEPGSAPGPPRGFGRRPGRAGTRGPTAEPRCRCCHGSQAMLSRAQRSARWAS